MFIYFFYIFIVNFYSHSLSFNFISLILEGSHAFTYKCMLGSMSNMYSYIEGLSYVCHICMKRVEMTSLFGWECFLIF